jgi:hypothetical protein
LRDESPVNCAIYFERPDVFIDTTNCGDTLTQRGDSMGRIPEQRFRLRKPTVAIGLDEASQHVVVSVPTGAEITVVDENLSHALWVTVNWKGRDLEMFADDLRNRGEPVTT